MSEFEKDVFGRWSMDCWANHEPTEEEKKEEIERLKKYIPVSDCCSADLIGIGRSQTDYLWKCSSCGKRCKIK